MDASNPEKSVFLKNLKVYTKMLGLEIVEDVLLVDNGPQKNLLNDVHSAIHPPTWSGDDVVLMLPIVVLWFAGTQLWTPE